MTLHVVWLHVKYLNINSIGMVRDLNFKLKKSSPFVSMTHLPYFSRERVAWLHEPQPNVLQKVRQNTVLELS